MKHRKKILPWPHYPSTSSNVPYQEISTDRLMLHTRKVQNWVTMNFIMSAQIALQHWRFEFSPGSTKSHIPKFWDHHKKLKKEQNQQQQQQPVHLVSHDGKKRNLTSMGEIIHVANVDATAKTTIQTIKTTMILYRKYMVKSSHHERKTNSYAAR